MMRHRLGLIVSWFLLPFVSMFRSLFKFPKQVGAKFSVSCTLDDDFRLTIEAKDWNTISHYWKSLLQVPNIPSFVKDLQAVGNAGKGEFSSKDERYKSRRTFALRVGYDGTKYHGYQRQVNVVTVEGDLHSVLRRVLFAAGRTDRGVSAVSQIVSFSTEKDLKPEQILESINQSDAVKEHRLAAYECCRVPKSFNSRSSATWRRYLYIVPLNVSTCGKSYDIDVSFVNETLRSVEGFDLPYNAFAFKEDRTGGEGLHDFCTLFRARAFAVDLTIPDVPLCASNLTYTHPQAQSSPINVPAFASPAMCIELVGNRFLRQMVRKISATVVREATRAPADRNVNIINDICAAGDRSLVAHPLPGQGLCFAGVGYDVQALSFYKFMPKVERLALEREYAAAGSTSGSAVDQSAPGGRGE